MGPSRLGRDHAIVRPTAAAQRIDVHRILPAPRWAPFIDYHWIVRWSCPEPYDQQVIPQPCVHVSAELHGGAPRLLVNGIIREPFIRTLAGDGHVLGVAFRPASFRAFLGADLSLITGRVAPVGDLLGSDDAPTAAAILRPETSDETMVGTVERYLDGFDVAVDPTAEAVNALVQEAERDRSLTQASALATRGGVSLRTLQRQFTSYLGIGPKWVIRRFRLLDAAAAAHAGAPNDWAKLAHDLGFSDQAHLTRAFTAVVGTPPAAYQRQA